MEPSRAMALRLFLRSRETSPNSSPSPGSSASGGFTDRLKRSQNCLIGNIEKVMSLFSEGKEFRSRGGTMNYVFPLDSCGDLFGYLKIGKEGEDGVVAMETFMYYVSVYFNISAFFTETNIIQITPRKLKRLSVPITGNDDDVKKKRNSLGDVLQKKIMNGSYQNALNGRTLKSYLNDGQTLSSIINDPVTRGIQFVLSSFYTIVLGMFDANAGNIIFEGDQMKFFDNTRCLPHSPEFIIWGISLQIAFRSALLELEETYCDLSTDQLCVLKKEVVKFGKLITNLDGFFQRVDVKKLTDQLPPGWFYPNLIISAMNYRLNGVYNRLKCDKIRTCEDMIHAAFPHYRFFVILYIVQEYLSKRLVINKFLSSQDGGNSRFLVDDDYIEFWRRGMIRAPTIDILDALQNCYFLGINVRELLTECLKPDFSYVNTLKNVYSKVKFIVDLDYIDDLLQEIEKAKDDFQIACSTLDISLFIVTGMLQNIEDPKYIKHPINSHKKTVESIRDDLADINVAVKKHIDGEANCTKDLIYRLHYVSELRNRITEIGDDILNYLISEKDESDLYFIIRYLYTQAEPDFKDIPTEKINEFVRFNLETELDKNQINYSRESIDNFKEYIIEIVESDDKTVKYNLKYKRVKWRIERIRVVELDIYSAPGFVKLVGKPKIKPMTVVQFVEWIPGFIREMAGE